MPSSKSARGARDVTSSILLMAGVTLIDNWIDTTPQPKPSDAAVVDAYDPLLARARRGGARRGEA